MSEDRIDRVELEIQNNVDWVQPFVAFDFDPNTNRHSIHDLTGAQLRMELRAVTFPPQLPGQSRPHPIVATTATLDLQTENGFILIASLPASGEFVISVPAITMFTVPAGDYVADMLVFGADGTVKPLFTLELEIEQGDTVPTPT